MMHMMIMYFHYRIEENILLEQWIPHNQAQYILSCVGVVALALIYEILRSLRLYLYRAFEKETIYNCKDGDAVTPIYGSVVYPDGCDCSKQPTFRPYSPKVLASTPHLLQTALHFCQELLGLSLMLVTMTYNTPLAIAVPVGHVLGHLFLAPAFSREERRRVGSCCCS